MGGYGSTRWGSTRTRRAVGSCYHLRPRDLRRTLRGLDQEAGRKMHLSWSSNGRELASIGGAVVCDAGAAELVLRYRATFGNRGSEIITDRVWLEGLAQRGATAGRRWWFRCPGCERRCGVLYLPRDETRFRCRICYGLTYRSCNESDKRVSRAVRAIQRGDGIPDVAGMDVSSLGVYLMAFKVYQQRAARALKRDVGKRAFYRHYRWLERV